LELHNNLLCYIPIRKSYLLFKIVTLKGHFDLHFDGYFREVKNDSREKYWCIIIPTKTIINWVFDMNNIWANIVLFGIVFAGTFLQSVFTFIDVFAIQKRTCKCIQKKSSYYMLMVVKIGVAKGF